MAPNTQKILIALRRTTSPYVRLLSERTYICRLKPSEAIKLVEQDPDCWEFKGSKRQVKSIARVPRKVKWVACWRTTRAAVFPPSPGSWPPK